jgi:acetyltransferase EpsM
MSDLVLIGGGEHARVVAEAAALAGLRVRGCVAPTRCDGLAWLGDDDAFRPLPGDRCILAVVGAPRSSLRRALASRHAALPWTAVVHPSAIVSPSARIAPGCFVAAGTIVGTAARLERHAILNTGAQLDHDGVLDEGANCAPGAVLGGGVRIGAWAFVGLGARIRDHAMVGEGALVGMGSVVLADVAPGATVYGVPAKPAGAEP